MTTSVKELLQVEKNYSQAKWLFVENGVSGKELIVYMK